jgi:uroporphyrinogen decarboxylase
MNRETLTSHDRIKSMFDHKEADRVPMFDEPWASTLERWHREGPPENVA